MNLSRTVTSPSPKKSRPNSEPTMFQVLSDQQWILLTDGNSCFWRKRDQHHLHQLWFQLQLLRFAKGRDGMANIWSLGMADSVATWDKSGEHVSKWQHASLTPNSSSGKILKAQIPRNSSWRPHDFSLGAFVPRASMHGIFPYEFTIKINRSCREIYHSSHASTSKLHAEVPHTGPWSTLKVPFCCVWS